MNGEEILNEVRLLIDNNQFARYNEINRAYRRLAHMTPATWLREESKDVINFENGVSEYTINIKGMRRINGLWVYGTDSGDIKWNFVEEADQKLFERKRSEHINLNGEARAGLPEFFKIISVQNDVIKIEITPEPDAAMSGRVDYTKEVAQIGRDTVPEMPTAYHDVIAQLAASYIIKDLDLQRDAMAQANMLMMDANSNKTKNIDRPKRSWLKTGYSRWGGYSRWTGQNRWRMY